MLSFSPLGSAITSPLSGFGGGCSACSAPMAAFDRLSQPMMAPASPMVGMEQSMNQTLMYLVGLLAGLMAQQQGGGGALGALGGFDAGALGGGGFDAGSWGGGGGSSAEIGGSSPNLPQGETAGVQKLIQTATAQQGKPYVFGATGPDKFDCSGLVYYSLKQAGANVPRLTAAGYQDRYKDSKVDRNNLKPGDLLFFWSKNDRGIPEGKATHVEIYLGNGMSMGTDSPKEGAKIEPVNWSTFIGGARPTELYK